jgi:hypothetical protein
MPSSAFALVLAIQATAVGACSIQDPSASISEGGRPAGGSSSLPAPNGRTVENGRDAQHADAETDWEFPKDPAASAEEILSSLLVGDVDGHSRRLGGTSESRSFALVFLGVECPISNKSVPVLRRIARLAGEKGAEFYGVVSDPAVTRAEARTFRDEYEIDFPLLFDASGELARRLGPTHTPEAFVFEPRGALAYRGRIDDSFVELGRPRSVTTSHDLEDAVVAAAEGRAPARSTAAAVGCVFEAWKDGGVPPSVNFNRDVAPILHGNCATCHRPGEVAPFSLLTYDDAARRSKTLARATEMRLMPPWKPVPGYGRFRESSRLTDFQIRILGAWANAGAPEGDPADLPASPTAPDTWRLGAPDLELAMPEPFTVPAEGSDFNQVFVIPMNLSESKVASAFEFRPGAGKAIHHALWYLDSVDEAARRDAEDPAPGFRAQAGLGFWPKGGLVGSYAAGFAPERFPEGTGVFVHRNAVLILEVHYRPTGKPEIDRSRVGVYFSKSEDPKRLQGIVLGTRAIDIPAGTKQHRVRSATPPIPATFRIVSIAPHMHLLGKSVRVAAFTPDRRVIPLIWIDDWDFRWQNQYVYRQPVTIPKGSRLGIESVYDNSAENPRNPHVPPRRVTYGEATTDEMQGCFLQILPDRPEHARDIRRAVAAMFLGARTNEEDEE